MISTLHHSQTSGTRNLKIEGIEFGWKVIVDMFAREMDRRKCNDRKLVPRMKESFVIRDSWTNLSVEPSKIMQVQLNFCESKLLLFAINRSKRSLQSSRVTYTKIFCHMILKMLK